MASGSVGSARKHARKVKRHRRKKVWKRLRALRIRLGKV